MIKFRSQLNQLVILSSAIIFFSILSSCEKEPDELGLGVLPGDDYFLVKTDTIKDILATTVRLDSIRTFTPDSSVKALYHSILGDYTNPLYGNSKASLLVNYYPDLDSAKQTFGTNPKVDSLIFYLSYDSVMGDKNTNMHFRISELKKTLSYKEQYYSDIDTSIYKDRLIIDTIVQFKDTLLKIKIKDPEFISKLINIPLASQETLTKFQEYFKGFYIETRRESGDGILAYVNLNLNSYSRLSLYYHNNTDTSEFRYNYQRLTVSGIQNVTVRVNKFSHDYTGTPVETALQNTELSQKTTYVQGLAGVSTRIRIPGISSWKANKKPVAINKAELIVPIDTTNNDTLFYPKRLSIMAISSTGKRSYIEYGFGPTFIGGVYDPGKKVYTFNLAKHLHKIANDGFENTDLVIVADGYKPFVTNSLSRVPLDFSPGKGAKLYVIYSKQ